MASRSRSQRGPLSRTRAARPGDVLLLRRGSGAHARTTPKRFFVFEGELTFRFEDEQRVERDLGVRAICGRAHVRGDGDDGSLPHLHAPRDRRCTRGAAQSTFDQLPTGSSGRESSSYAGREEPRERRSPTVRTVARRSSSTPTSSPSRSSRTAQGSAGRSCTSIASTRMPSSSSRESSRSSCTRECSPSGRNLRRSSLRTSCTASTTTAPRTCAASTSTRPRLGFGDYLRGQNPEFDQHDPPADGGADPSSIVAVRLAG